MLKLTRLLPRRRDKQCTLPAEADEPWQSEAHGELSYVHRSLIVLRPREPYARWVRTVEPGAYPLEQARQDDAIAFLIPMQFGTVANSQEFLAEHWAHFFAQALEQIEQDRERWPQQRSLAMMRHWFDIELCQAVIDLGGDGDGP